ncbi:MAG: cation:proton antiporter [Thermoplasmata archaeon]|nr:cation:proton antiporter [Thermoplasmata archaeon]
MAFVPSGPASALLEIFIFLAGAEAIRFRLSRIGVPQIVGEVLLGMLLAPLALGNVINGLVGFSLFNVNTILLAFADFSVILIIFAAGLEGGVSGLRSAGSWAVLGAVAGNLVPFLVTYLVFSHLFPSTMALLLAVAAGSTSTAVTASLIRNEQLGGSAGAKFLLSTTAMDDVVGLVLLSVILSLVGGQFNLITVTGSIALDVLVWVGVLIGSVLVIPRVFRAMGPRETYNLPFLILFILAAVVTAVGFSTVVGAYIAGLAIAESVVASRTRQTLDVLVLVFGSLFFVVIGFEFHVNLLLNPLVWGIGILLALIAVGGKVLAIYPVALRRFRRRSEAVMIAVGMIPRGEIGLIVGAIGISLNVLNQEGLGAILLMSILTTGIGGFLFHAAAKVARAEYVHPDESTAPPTGERGPGDRANGS